jgi:serine/threonine protein kinase
MVEVSDKGEIIPKFIDFGLSKILYFGEGSFERYGTLAYSSPEILLG